MDNDSASAMDQPIMESDPTSPSSTAHSPPPASPPAVLQLEVRGMEEGDWSYIVKTWILQTGKTQTSLDRMARRYNSLRSRGAKFLVAYPPEHHNLILGFIAFEDFENRSMSVSILHFAYTKERYRKKGVLRSLLAAAGFGPHRQILCSHWSPDASEVRARIPVLIPILP